MQWVLLSAHGATHTHASESPHIRDRVSEGGEACNLHASTWYRILGRPPDRTQDDLVRQHLLGRQSCNRPPKCRHGASVTHAGDEQSDHVGVALGRGALRRGLGRPPGACQLVRLPVLRLGLAWVRGGNARGPTSSSGRLAIHPDMSAQGSEWR